MTRPLPYFFALAFLAFSVGSSAGEAAKALTDEEIAKILINRSVAAYPGNCPCPYNLAKNGSRCGKRSAYSKPGGYAPLCYPADISKAMIEDYRRKHQNQS